VTGDRGEGDGQGDPWLLVGVLLPRWRRAVRRLIPRRRWRGRGWVQVGATDDDGDGEGLPGEP
jgi:hypothetical protein